MNTPINLLLSTPLFADITPADLPTMLSCLGAKTAPLKKHEFTLLQGDPPKQIGIVLTGQLHIFKENDHGDRTLIAAVHPGELFAEALCCAHVAESPVSVMAETDSTILLLEFRRILSTCTNACDFHRKLIDNMLGIIARKNLLLQKRLDILSQKTLRMKLLTYLESFPIKRGITITIPFNREKLADFLSTDRSALSHELSRMQDEGLIEYKKNRFRLL